MTCRETRQHWHLYHDSEGDARLHLEIEEHLGVCPACAEWFHQQSHLEDQLAQKLRDVPADPVIWDRVLTTTGLQKPQPARRWRWISGMALAASVLLVVAGWQLFRPAASSGDLSQVSATWHERLQTGEEPVQFVSNSDHDVEVYLKDRVPFPVRCPPRRDAGFSVRGAGVCEIEGRPAAYLRGEVGETPVSILVMPRDSLDSFPRQLDAVRRHGVHHAPAGQYAMVLREFDRNAIVVVGRTDPTALERVVNAYGSYPDHN